MLRVFSLHAVPIIGSKRDEEIIGAHCIFVCQDSHPDPEAYLCDCLAEFGLQPESIEKSALLWPELLPQYLPNLAISLEQRGYGLEIHGYREKKSSS
jgi:hypothetical protein